MIDTVGFKMTYTVLQYEELQIDPTVAFTRNPIPEGNLSYEWYIYQPGKTATWKPVSTEKKLDIPVSHVPGDYKAVIYVTDNSRGVTSNMEFDLIVSTDIHHGFVIVHGSNGETDFDYLATPNSIPDLDRVKWLRNILEANGRKLPGNPTTIRVAGRNYGNFNAMYVASDQDLFQIDDKTFQFLHDADELFIDKPAEVNVVGLGVNGDTRLFFMANGDMHEIMSDRPTWDYAIPAPIAISDAVEGEVKVWKENVLPNGYSYLYPMVVYDVAGQRFLGRNNYPACRLHSRNQGPGNILISIILARRFCSWAGGIIILLTQYSRIRGNLITGFIRWTLTCVPTRRMSRWVLRICRHSRRLPVQNSLRLGRWVKF